VDDLTALILLASLFSAVLAVAGGLPVRLLDWIDRHILAPPADREETA
jgi:hypothetical protein